MAQLIRKIICSAKAPKPVGPYNQAVQVGNTVYLSGVLGIDPATNQMVSGGAASEAQQIMTNLKAILAEANSSIDNVVKSTVFLDDINDFGAFNEVYKNHFKEPYPARSCFQVGKLPMGAKVEIEVIAISGHLVNAK